MPLDSLFMPRQAESRTVSAENPTGAKGGAAKADPAKGDGLHASTAAAAADLGVGWKVSPCAPVPARTTLTLMDVAGPGVIRHLWMTLDPKFHRSCILRVYYDARSEPAVEVPVGDFFGAVWGRLAFQSIALAVGTSGGLNSYLPMPFRRRVRIELENQASADLPSVFWAFDYSLEAVEATAMYLHAIWNQSQPVVDGIHEILPGAVGPGRYVGTFLAWQQNSSGWWGEGEVKFYIDDDDPYPTITSTGTEDYFGGAWSFTAGDYESPFFGYATVVGTNGEAGARHAMYRFHLLDPIEFHDNILVDIQALGWASEQRYRLLEDDLASVAYWYQADASAPPLAMPSSSPHNDSDSTE